MGGQPAVKAASQVGVDAAITIEQQSKEPDYVSRGGRKLAGALPADSLTCCFGPVRLTSSRSTSATDSSRGHCRLIRG